MRPQTRVTPAILLQPALAGVADLATAEVGEDLVAVEMAADMRAATVEAKVVARKGKLAKARARLTRTIKLNRMARTARKAARLRKRI